MSLPDVLRFVSAHPLNKGHRLEASGRFLRWQLATRLLPYPVALPFVDNLRMFVERGMTGATGNFYCGLHEAEDMAFVLHYLRSGDDFYDIGANIGSYTLLAVAAGVHRVIAFEPSAETARRFQQNMALNGLLERVTLHQLALGEAEGKVQFSRGADTTNHVLADGETTASETVRVARLDRYFEGGRPAFLKMDVEGFEWHVFGGAKEMLASPSLRGMLVEDNGSEARYGEHHSVATLLRRHGFNKFSYDPYTRRLEPCTKMGNTGNALYLRDQGEAQRRVASGKRYKLVNGWI